MAHRRCHSRRHALCCCRRAQLLQMLVLPLLLLLLAALQTRSSTAHTVGLLKPMSAFAHRSPGKGLLRPVCG